MKKYITLLVLMQWHGHVHAQENKPTGGCAYSAYIVSISPPPTTGAYLQNNISYSVDVELQDLNIPCTGDIRLEMDDIPGKVVLGKKANCWTGIHTLVLDSLNVTPGEHTLSLYFTGGYASQSGGGWGPLMQQKKYKVMNPRTSGMDDINQKIELNPAAAPVGDTEGKFELYPNPAINVIYLNVPNLIREICIINTNGQMIRKLTPYIRNVQIPVSDLPEGFYILKIATPDGILHKKVIVAR